MRRLLILILLLAPCVARAELPAILLGATFTSSTSAAVTWQQPPDAPGLTVTCLVREYGAVWPAGICYNDLPAGPVRVELPGQLTHPAYRPAYGDRYLLQINGATVGQATLGEAEVYTYYLAPITVQRSAPQRLTYLPALQFSAAAAARSGAADSAAPPRPRVVARRPAG